MKIEVTFLGIGSQFNPKLGNSNLLIELHQEEFIPCPWGVPGCTGPQGEIDSPDTNTCEKCVALYMRSTRLRVDGECYRILVGCGFTAHQKLTDAGISHKDIDAYLLTSLRSDHVGGLELAMKMNYLLENRRYYEDGGFDTDIPDAIEETDLDDEEFEEIEEKHPVDTRPFLIVPNSLIYQSERSGGGKWAGDLRTTLQCCMNDSCWESPVELTDCFDIKNRRYEEFPPSLFVEDRQIHIQHPDRIRIDFMDSTSLLNYCFKITCGEKRIAVVGDGITPELVQMFMDECSIVLLLGNGPLGVLNVSDLLFDEVKTGRIIAAGLTDGVEIPERLPPYLELAVPFRRYCF